MSLFLRRILLYALPIVVLAIVSELMLRRIPNDYKKKVEYLDKHSNEIETLILGSSHTFYGVNPVHFESKAYNAAYVSQSIDIDFKIIKKYQGKLASLRLIVIPIDYSTLFSRLENSPENWRLKNYEIYFDIDVSGHINDHFEVLSNKLDVNYRRLKSYYLLNKRTIGVSEMGFGKDKKKQKDLIESGVQAAERHTKSKLNYEANVKVLSKIIQFCEKKDVKLLLFTTPAYKSYVENISERQLSLMYHLVDSLVSKNENCFYFNLLKDSAFVASDFRDADHLNKSGARKLSMKLNKVMYDSLLLKSD